MSESSNRADESPDVLDRAARLERFAQMAGDDEFPEDALPRVESLIEDSSWVSGWFSRALLIYGLTLVAVGIIFFFGFNWDKVPDLAKLGMIQIGFAGSLAAGSLRDIHSVTSRIFLVVAGVLVGVFLAVFGQVYQTSADAWEFFAIWAAILLPLALLAGTQGAWVLLGVVATTAGLTGLDQVGTTWPSGWLSLVQASTVVAAAGFVLGVTEWLRHQGAGLVEEFPWSRPLLLACGFGVLTLRVCLSEGAGPPIGALLASIGLLVVCSVAAGWFYIERRPDLSAPGIVGLSWLIVALRFVGEVLSEIMDEEIVFFLVMAVVTTGLTAGLVAVLTRLKRMIDQNPDQEAS